MSKGALVRLGGGEVEELESGARRGSFPSSPNTAFFWYILTDNTAETFHWYIHSCTHYLAGELGTVTFQVKLN